MDSIETARRWKAYAPRLALVDLIAYVVLAACIGLATGITLAGVVMLLAQDAQAAAPQARRPGNVQQAAAPLCAQEPMRPRAAGRPA